MKMQLIVAAILTLFVIYSCSKRNDPPSAEEYYFRGKEDGVFFSDTVASISNNILAYYPDGPPQTQISAHHDIGGVTLAVSNITIGERLLNPANPNDYIRLYVHPTFYYTAGLTGSYQGSGKINILEITSSYIRGTFECIAPPDSFAWQIGLPPKQFTEGEFKVKKP